MREEIHGDAGTHALLVAQQENLFELGQPLATHREKNLVDHAPAKQLGEVRQRMDPVNRLQADSGVSARNPISRTPYFADASSSSPSRLALSPRPTTIT